jgi:arylsulfatase A-like enzyme
LDHLIHERKSANAGTHKPGTVENGIFSGVDWYPTLVAAAGDPNITQKLLKGVKLGDVTYKNHLDGYNQLALLEGNGPSARHEIFYLGGPKLGAVRIDNFKYQFYDQPEGWPGPKIDTDMPKIYNIRQDPFERTPIMNFLEGAPAYFNEFFGREVGGLSTFSNMCCNWATLPSSFHPCRTRPLST